MASANVIHVIAGLNPHFGGPSYSVPRLCKALATAGVATSLLSVVETPRDGVITFDQGYRERRFAINYAYVPILRDLRRSSGLAQALRDISAADVIHNHGLWLMPNIEAARAAARAGKPFIVSPRGMLAPAALTFSKLKKRFFWKFLQGSAVRGSRCIHATSEQEYEDIRALGLANPIAIVPNGIDVPDLSQPPTSGSSDARIVLTLGRIHPKKGLDRLLYAWERVAPRNPGWRLRIVGPAEAGHDRELRTLARKIGLTNVSIEGPVYGDLRQAAYSEADIFVLPSLNENFGLTVAEALAFGTPVISTKGAPWSGLNREGCGWWIDQGIEPLATALSNAMLMPPHSLRAMGAKGRAWMARDFSWDRVAHQMLDIYRWAAGCAPASSAIRFN